MARPKKNITPTTTTTETDATPADDTPADVATTQPSQDVVPAGNPLPRVIEYPWGTRTDY